MLCLDCNRDSRGRKVGDASRDARNDVPTVEMDDEIEGHKMKTTAAENSINEVPELDEDEFEFSMSIHPPFKDANDFGRPDEIRKVFHGFRQYLYQ